MPNQNLSDYIKQATTQGMSKEKITEELLKAGWDQNIINEEFNNNHEISKPIIHYNKSKKINLIITASIVIVFIIAFVGYLIKIRTTSNNNTQSEVQSIEPKSEKTETLFKDREVVSGTRPVSISPEDFKNLISSVEFSTVSSHFSDDVPENFLKNLGIDKRPGDIIRTDDNQFWFIDGSDYCNNPGYCNHSEYILNIEKREISDINIDNVSYSVQPLSGSYALLIDKIGGSDKLSIFNAASNKIEDEIIEEEINDNQDINEYEKEVKAKHIININLGPGNFYTYTMGEVLYSRDITKHTSTPLNHFYDPGSLGIDFMKVPAEFSSSGDIVYTLSYVDKMPTENNQIAPEYKKFTPAPLNLVAWDLKNNTKKIIAEQTFNYPFYFILLPNNNLLIGGGRSRFGEETLQSYLVNVDTGETKLIYNKITNFIDIDQPKETINIKGANLEGSYWGPNDYDTLTIFDYTGKLISETQHNE